METMSYTEECIVDAYSILFNNLSDRCKFALVEKLSRPDEKTPKEGDGFEASFGGWEGSDMSAEEIKAEIKANRQFIRLVDWGYRDQKQPDTGNE